MKVRAWLARWRLLAALGAAVALADVAGLIWFAEAIPRTLHDSGRTTDAIVVLTGGQLRFGAGLALLSEGRGKKLFVSGVNRGVDVGELLRVAGRAPGPAPCCIAIGHAADNTTGNAQETRAWMEREGFRSLRLVTANYHMRRSLLEFHRAMPEFEIVPHPVFPDSVRRDEWWQRRGTLILIASEYHKYLAALARSLVVPRIGSDTAA